MTLLNYYSYLVAMHVTAVVFLVGGLLAQNQMMRAIAQFPQEQQAGALVALLCLDRRVMTPALLLVWMFGLLLAISAKWFTSHWLMAKLIFVVALSAAQGMQSGRLRRCVRDGLRAPSVPLTSIGIVVAMLVIAILAFGKPI